MATRKTFLHEFYMDKESIIAEKRFQGRMMLGYKFYFSLNISQMSNSVIEEYDSVDVLRIEVI